MAKRRDEGTKATSTLGTQIDLFSADQRPDRPLTQHNDLIRAQYDMSLLEMRLFIALLARINRGDKEFSICKIPVNELFYQDDKKSIEDGTDKTASKVGGKTYSQIKKAVVRLAGRTVTIESRDEKGNREIISNPLMATCRYKEKSGYVMAQFNNFVKPYLLELSGGFTTAQELTLMNFRSFYSFRIYWLLKLSAFKYDVIQSGLAEMKQMFNLVGKYANFSDFKRFVLDVAQEELAATDMAFDYVPNKDGRAVTGVTFTLLRPTMVNMISEELPEAIHNRLTAIGLSLKALADIKLRFQQGKLEEEYIHFVLQYYDQLQHKAQIRSLAAIVYKAIISQQLVHEFTHWKNNRPVYKAPVMKGVAQVTEEVISLAELKKGWEAMFRKGLTPYDSFEASLEQYTGNPEYQFIVRNGVDCLVYKKIK
ncbi:replication initiation protein [Arsenicibacter rosenii]|uniref:Initiator Rep protein WH1 domain-containing protein n=1 Tax=Arsenicibacter rosenii TaxID=1750698 RepID=A0A1S2V9X6_9BACT|nr:replication initiation protein [Arsenicibacter rosenii]OIN55479.1 hypothetical protein BLX24_30160 [Arsenicibacter rosenii]